QATPAPAVARTPAHKLAAETITKLSEPLDRLPLTLVLQNFRGGGAGDRPRRAGRGLRVFGGSAGDLFRGVRAPGTRPARRERPVPGIPDWPGDMRAVDGGGRVPVRGGWGAFGGAASGC